jgi:hypothetical protein
LEEAYNGKKQEINSKSYGTWPRIH